MVFAPAFQRCASRRLANRLLPFLCSFALRMQHASAAYPDAIRPTAACNHSSFRAACRRNPPFCSREGTDRPRIGGKQYIFRAAFGHRQRYGERKIAPACRSSETGPQGNRAADRACRRSGEPKLQSGDHGRASYGRGETASNLRRATPANSSQSQRQREAFAIVYDERVSATNAQGRINLFAMMVKSDPLVEATQIPCLTRCACPRSHV